MLITYFMILVYLSSQMGLLGNTLVIVFSAVLFYLIYKRYESNPERRREYIVLNVIAVLLTGPVVLAILFQLFIFDPGSAVPQEQDEIEVIFQSSDDTWDRLKEDGETMTAGHASRELAHDIWAELPDVPESVFLFVDPFVGAYDGLLVVQAVDDTFDGVDIESISDMFAEAFRAQDEHGLYDRILFEWWYESGEQAGAFYP